MDNRFSIADDTGPPKGVDQQGWLGPSATPAFGGAPWAGNGIILHLAERKGGVIVRAGGKSGCGDRRRGLRRPRARDCAAPGARRQLHGRGCRSNAWTAL